jgi:hypothetical protein
VVFPLCALSWAWLGRIGPKAPTPDGLPAPAWVLAAFGYAGAVPVLCAVAAMIGLARGRAPAWTARAVAAGGILGIVATGTLSLVKNAIGVEAPQPGLLGVGNALAFVVSLAAAVAVIATAVSGLRAARPVRDVGAAH